MGVAVTELVSAGMGGVGDVAAKFPDPVFGGLRATPKPPKNVGFYRRCIYA